MRRCREPPAPLPGSEAALVGLAALVAVVIPLLASRGETYYHRAPDTGPRRTLTRFVGYLGPSGFGLCAAKLIETGHVVAVLWLAIMLAHDGVEEIIVCGMTGYCCYPVSSP